MATMTAYNSPVFNNYWNVIKDWSNEWKDALVSKILRSKDNNKAVGSKAQDVVAKDIDATVKPTSILAVPNKHYAIDDIAGILACDASDDELLDEYLSEKYGV